MSSTSVSPRVSRSATVTNTVIITLVIMGFVWLKARRSALERSLAQRPLKPPLIEISGVARHLSRPDLYWSHNDSLDRPRLFLIDQRGALISEHDAAHRPHAETSVKNSIKSSVKTPVKASRDSAMLSAVSNVDWEDITSVSEDPYDGERIIYVADSGNNFHWRDDLVIYAFSEPQRDHDPLRLLSVYPYRFPHQTRSPPTLYRAGARRCLDSEAMFWWRGELFLIGKCIFGGETTLWRLPRERLDQTRDREESGNRPHRHSQLTLEASAPVEITPDAHPLRERVTGAALDPRSDSLAVLTYQSVWLFSIGGSPHAPMITKRARCLLAQASAQPVHQAEAIEWEHQAPADVSADKRSLLILTEGRGVHSLTIDVKRWECL